MGNHLSSSYIFNGMKVPCRNFAHIGAWDYRRILMFKTSDQ